MKLPLLLSGPILRRSHTKGVLLWLATSRPFTIDAHLFHIDPADSESPSHHAQITDKPIKGFSYSKLNILTKQYSCNLGKQLYIYLIELIPKNEAFPSDCLLGYNLFFTSRSEAFDLGDMGLLDPDGPDSIIYDPFIYPTFILKQETRTNYLYGSCRKWHGKGRDQLPQADTVLSAQATELEERPDALFLIGDQIYADDVAGPIRPFLTTLGKTLLGDERSEPLDQLDPRLRLEPFPKALHQINGRQFIMNELASFTSQNAYNHLMTFGEFAAMYVMNWSPALWETLKSEGGLPSFKEVKSNECLYLSFPKNDPMFRHQATRELKQAKKKYNDQFTNLMQFSEGLASVRRLLANIPTYMIFDDHDITDDWNLSHKWYEKVRESPLGSHIIANGLTAYWAFQGWGNDPQSFGPLFIHKIERYFHSLDVTSPEHDDWLNHMLKFSDWPFVAPTSPRTLFLDTRTMRGYDPIPQPVQIGKKTYELPLSAELIGSKGWKKTETILFKSDWEKGAPLILISATPLYGIELIENFVLKYIYPLRSFGFPADNRFDIEAWKDNGKGFTQFLEKLEDWVPNPCFILSGDVHYGFQAESTIEFPNKDRSPKTYYQFTSSPIKNMSFDGFFGWIVKWATRLHSPLRKQNQVNQYCDKSYSMIAKKQLINDPMSINWYERIDYKRNPKGQIMETENNMGIIRLNTHHSVSSKKDLDWTHTFFSDHR